MKRELRQEVTYRGYENLTPPGRIAATVGRTLAMKPKHSRSGFATPIIRNLVAVLCSVVLVPGDIGLLASQAPSQVAAAADK